MKQRTLHTLSNDVHDVHSTNIHDIFITITF